MMQCLGCRQVVILGFPPVVCLSSNWGRYWRCSHGWRSGDWRSQLLQFDNVSGDNQPGHSTTNPGLWGFSLYLVQLEIKILNLVSCCCWQVSGRYKQCAGKSDREDCECTDVMRYSPFVIDSDCRERVGLNCGRLQTYIPPLPCSNFRLAFLRYDRVNFHHALYIMQLLLSVKNNEFCFIFLLLFSFCLIFSIYFKFFAHWGIICNAMNGLYFTISKYKTVFRLFLFVLIDHPVLTNILHALPESTLIQALYKWIVLLLLK